MCGIVGLLNIGGAPIDAKTLHGMTDCLRHRGPDDEGYLLIETGSGDYGIYGGNDTCEDIFTSNYTFSPHERLGTTVSTKCAFNLAFGHRRLSIIDVSPSGHQPMSNSSGTLWIVYNGEIYNYIELRAELKNRGREFFTQSDTEVILQAYEEWGDDCLNRFNGMWSFALWDVRKGRLFCSRDRFGVKPFYYYWDGEYFAFASEIKALLRYPVINARPNTEAIYRYLISGQSEGINNTFFDCIKQLEPGHSLTVSESGLSQHRYYTLGFNSELGVFDEKRLLSHSQEFMGLLKDAIKIRLRSDVSLGVCLSGGIDSSAIVCIVNELLKTNGYSRSVIGDRQRTFSACYASGVCDERKFIQEVLMTTDVDTYYTFPTGKGLWEEMDTLIWHMEEPFGSTSIYAHWDVMRLAKEHRVPVILDGQGADEMMAGYHTYLNVYLSHLLYEKRWRTYWREFNAIRRITNNPVFSVYSFLIPLYNALPTDMRTQMLNNFVKKRILKIQDPGLLNRSFLAKRSGEDRTKIESNLQTALLKSETEYGLIEQLRYDDKISMAFSLETRVPYVDYRLVEFVFSLPACYKIHDGWTKYLLRAGTKGLLPEAIRWRKDKLGFPTPERAWLRGNKKKVQEIFGNKNFRASDYLNQKQILHNLDSLLGGESSDGLSAIWKPLNLELWLQRMFP